MQCTWPLSVRNLSHDRLQAFDLEAGDYTIDVYFLDTKERCQVRATVESARIPEIVGYDILHASSDLARDGTITALCKHLDLLSDVRFLWTSHVITNEPVLHDVSPGTYFCNILSNDDTSVQQTSVPAVVEVQKIDLQHPEGQG